MIKKYILIIMPLVLALVLSACSPVEPPVESPADSSTPIGTPADTPLDTPAETSEPYDFSKIRFRTDEVMPIGEIKDIEEYNAKTAELAEACRNFEPVRIENGVKHPDYIMFDVMFNSGCDMSDEEIAEIKTVKQITTAQMQELMSPWISGNSVLKNYLPQMWEIEFTTKSDLETVGPEFSQHARFLPHARALKTSTSAGWKMIAMSSLILILTLGAIGFCISYIAHNTAMLHRRELEILNQVGASDNFIARQMQIIVGKICLSACSIGYLCALPIILVILSTAHSARIGLMAMLGLSGTGWILLTILPITIIIFSIWITKRTTINILKNS